MDGRTIYGRNHKFSSSGAGVIYPRLTAAVLNVCIGEALVESRPVIGTVMVVHRYSHAALVQSRRERDTDRVTP